MLGDKKKSKRDGKFAQENKTQKKRLLMVLICILWLISLIENHAFIGTSYKGNDTWIYRQ